MYYKSLLKVQDSLGKGVAKVPENNVRMALKNALSQVYGDRTISEEELEKLIKTLKIPEDLNPDELNSYLLQQIDGVYSDDTDKIKKVKNFGQIVVDENTELDELKEFIDGSIKAIGDKSYRLISISEVTEGFNDHSEGYSKFGFLYSSNVVDNKRGVITVYFKSTPPVLSATSCSFEGTQDTDSVDLMKNVSASDTIDGDLKDGIEIEFNGLDLKREGNYPIVYYVKNSRGVGSRLCVWYGVKADAPKLVVHDIAISAGDPLDGETISRFVTAIDPIDGDLSDQIKIRENHIDLKRQGTYDVDVFVTNSNGKLSESTTKLIITAQKPTIIAKDAQISAGSQIDRDTYMEDVHAVDDVDGDITDKVQCDFSDVDTQRAGDYKVMLSVRNSNSLQTDVSANIRVVAGNPVITANDFVVTANSNVNWLSASDAEAHDAVDGDLSSFITYFNSDVKLDVPGNYSVYYMVRNSNDKQATTRVTVHVVE